MSRPAFEVAGIFRAHGSRYREQHGLPFHQLKLMHAIDRVYSEAWKLRSCVPSSDPIQRFQDILDNIGRVEEYTMGMDRGSAPLRRQAIPPSRKVSKLRSMAEEAQTFPGQKCAASATFCATSTTASNGI